MQNYKILTVLIRINRILILLNCNILYHFEQVDKTWYHMNNTHNNRLPLAELLHYNFYIHRKTDRHPWAFFPLLGARI